MFDETKSDQVETTSPAASVPVPASVPADSLDGPATEPVPAREHEANGVPAAAEEDHTRYAEAGRKGAARVHQLIRLGVQYEQEHGLKRGRQRIRQLIEEGKLYEQEHGLRPARKARKRLGRLGREQLVRTLLEAVARMARPSYRQQLREVLAALEGERHAG